VFAKPTLYEWRTVQENIALPLEIAKVNKTMRDTKITEILDLMNLHPFKKVYPGQLSIGMQQRVAIARALTLQPKVLLLDDPFAEVDDFSREQLQDEFLHIKSTTRCTVVMASHSTSEAVYLADRILALSPQKAGLTEIVIPFARPRHKELRTSLAYYETIKMVRACFDLPHAEETEARLEIASTSDNQFNTEET
jgi:NitT/TauT family transport system ATP-binding protein